MPTSCGVKDLPFFPPNYSRVDFYAVTKFMTYGVYPEAGIIRIHPSDHPVRLPSASKIIHMSMCMCTYAFQSIFVRKIVEYSVTPSTVLHQVQYLLYTIQNTPHIIV